MGVAEVLEIFTALEVAELCPELEDISVLLRVAERAWMSDSICRELGRRVQGIGEPAGDQIRWVVNRLT